MEKSTVNVKVDGNEVIIRHGKAPDIQPRQNIIIHSVDINAPFLYWTAKKSLHDPINCIIHYSKNVGEIFLEINPFNKEEKDIIEGKLTPNPELQKLGINTGNKKGYKEMLESLKWMRSLFKNKQQYQDIISRLTNYN